MYGELLQIKIQYNDEENKELTKSIFDKLVTTTGSPKFFISEGNQFEYFDFLDFKKAREDCPELFDWLDFPEQYIDLYLKE